MNDPVRQAAVKLLRFVPDDFPDIVAASLGHEAAEDAADAMHALRAALDAPLAADRDAATGCADDAKPGSVEQWRAAADSLVAHPRGVTVEEVYEEICDAGGDIYDFNRSAAARAMMPLIERARLAGFAEGIEAAAGECDTRTNGLLFDAEQAKKSGDDGPGVRYTLGGASALRRAAASIRSLAPVARDAKAVPALALSELVAIHHEAMSAATEADNLAGNPSRWGATRGMKAALEALGCRFIEGGYVVPPGCSVAPPPQGGEG